MGIMFTKTSKKIHLKKSFDEIILWIALMISMFGSGLTSLGCPAMVRYSVDLCLVILVIRCIYEKRKLVVGKVLMTIVILFLLYTIVIYILNYQSIIYYLWGVRNNFRFYLLFFLCIMILSRKEIEYYFKLFESIFWLNFIVVLYQYFVRGIMQDKLGGIFGTEAGCNAFINIYLSIMMSIMMIKYLHKQESLFKFLVFMAVSIIIAALAELKYFFIELIIIVAVGILITDFSVRKLFIVLATLGAISVGISMLTALFPSFADFFSVESIMEYTSEGGYSSQNTVNRTTFMEYCNTYFLKEPSKQWFGLGLGNCDGSTTFDVVTSSFYSLYSVATRYTWMYTAFTYLETGKVGLMFILIFFIALFIMSRMIMRKDPTLTTEAALGQLMAVCMVMNAIYNASMRSESAYMLYFLASFPFALMSRKNECS